MNWDAVVGMVVPTVFFVTVGGVIVLRPIASRLGALLDAMARERSGSPGEETLRLREEVEMMSERLVRLEERQDFTERLIGSGTSGDARPGEGEMNR